MEDRMGDGAIAYAIPDGQADARVAHGVAPRRPGATAAHPVTRSALALHPQRQYRKVYQ